MKHPDTRSTVYEEDASIVEHHAHAADQYVMRLHAPHTAAHAKPGNFVHLQCGAELPMRRPMSILRADRNNSCIDIMYKIHGEGTKRLAQHKTGDRLRLLGPIGASFKLGAYRRLPLLLGGGVGIPPMIFLAEHIRKFAPQIKPFVILGSEIPFPFKPRPSRIMVRGLPPDVIAAMPLLDEWGIPSRLTSLRGYPGCHEGFVTDLARFWLDDLVPEHVTDIEIFACGPMPMLRAVSLMAEDYHLPCQISVEEYMACAIGGCAGCTIAILTENGLAMKRVCVDGPVFDAYSVFPPGT